jgi:hypothetical protein
MVRKLMVAACLGAAALISTTAIADASPLTASANQHPIGGSGIQGRIQFTDDGSSLTVDGTATGLAPNTPYFSLIYTNGTTSGGVSESKSLPPSSNAQPACNDVNKSGTSDINTNQMVIGFWSNHNDGTGTLHAVKTASGNSQDPLFLSIPGVAAALESFGYVFGTNSYTPIGSFPTVSIRNAANNFALVACGEVH